MGMTNAEITPAILYQIMFWITIAQFSIFNPWVVRDAQYNEDIFKAKEQQGDGNDSQ
jgi:hypothetical protein